MIIDLQALYNHQYEITEEVLTSEQKTSSFFVSCSIFFDEVDILLPYNEDKEILPLVEKHGDFSVFEKREDGYIAVMPDDYNTFKLPIKYHADFLMVCESVILTTSLKNLNMLKNIGVEESVQQVPHDYQTVRELLRKRHNIGKNTYVGTD